MNKRQYRIKRGKEKKIVGVRSATLKDSIFLLLFALIISGIFKASLPVYKNIQVHISKAFASQTKAESKPKLVAIVSPLPSPTPVEDRVRKLGIFLNSNNSPLAPYTQLIIDEADKYDIGWTKIVAISGMESKYGNSAPQGSYNAWGIGGSRFMYFSSWEEGIRYTSWLLGNSYKWNENAGIQQKYCPSSDGCNPGWVTIVTNTTREILATGDIK